MAVRRSHTKSRNGCDQCKTRRIKCDEAQPCLNCSKRQLSCSFQRHMPHGERSRLTPGSEAQSDSRDYNSSLLLRKNDIADDGLNSLQLKIVRASLLSQEWTSLDPELMHHFTIDTYKTIAKRQSTREAWQIVLPQIAYSNEFLMHGILALSALHLSHLKPERGSWYLTNSRSHISFGLRAFRKILLTPTSENCCALFVFSGILMAYISAISPDPTAEIENSDSLESILEVFKICQGILVLRPFMQTIRSSPLGVLFRREFSHPQPPVDTRPSSGLFQGAEAQLDLLSRLIEIEESDPERKNVYHQVLACLRSSFRSIDQAEPPVDGGFVFVWPITVEKEFFDILSERHPLALVLLAFYCTQLHVFDDFWWMGRRGRLLFSEILALLPERLLGWLEWPRNIISQD